MDSYDTFSEWDVKQCRHGKCASKPDNIAEEVPVALVYNGISHAVMLATPADLEDFALGFSMTEGIISDPTEMYGCEIVEAVNGIRVEMDIASEAFFHLKERRRTLAGRTGCGLCGTDSLSQAVRLPDPVGEGQIFSVGILLSGFDKMESLQVLRQATGATHAAAWLDENGDVALLREDVGRHNALDKLIGALLARRIDGRTGAVLVTSRASYEMVQKCASAKIGLLAAVSAPTALAVRIAKETDMTLVGFVHQDSYTVYTDSGRLR